MDLATIQLHLDNFVNTWAGWAKVFANLGPSIWNFAVGIDLLSGPVGSSTFFPNISN